MLAGATLAHIGGYFGGKVDWMIGRAVDVWMSFPPVVLSLVLDDRAGCWHAQRHPCHRAVLVDWTRFCRVLRAEVLVTTRQDRCGGGEARRRRLQLTGDALTREILPAIRCRS